MGEKDWEGETRSSPSVYFLTSFSSFGSQRAVADPSWHGASGGSPVPHRPNTKLFLPPSPINGNHQVKKDCEGELMRTSEKSRVLRKDGSYCNQSSWTTWRWTSAILKLQRAKDGAQNAHCTSSKPVLTVFFHSAEINKLSKISCHLK